MGMTTHTVKFDKFNHKNLTFSEWNIQNNRRNCYSRYESKENGPDTQLNLQLPWMNIFKYGMPNVGEYFATENDTAFIKMPLDLSNSEVKQVYDQMVSFDKVMSGSKMKKHLFGPNPTNIQKHKYIPCVKNTDSTEDDSPPWMKFKLGLEWIKDADPSDDKVVKTGVWESVKDTNDPNGKKRIRTRKDVSSIPEFRNNVSYLSNVRIIIKPTKLWAMNEKLAEPTYGVTWAMVKVEVEPRASNNSLDAYKNNDTFIDSDDEDVPTSMSSSVVDNNNDVDNDSNDESEDDDDSDDDSESDEEEEVAPPKPVMKKKKSSKNKNP